MMMQDFLFIMSPIGLYITITEWRNLVETANGNRIKIVGRIFMLNLPLILLINHLLLGVYDG